MKPDEYIFWKEQFNDFTLKHLFTHIEGTSLVLLTTISSIFLLSGIIFPFFAYIGIIGFMAVISISVLIKVEIKLYEIRERVNEIYSDMFSLSSINISDRKETKEKIIEKLEDKLR